VACSTGLLGTWSEVEPIDGTSIDQPEDGKVRRRDRGSTLAIEPGRITIAATAEHLDSSLVIEQLSDGKCMLHARDNAGRPLDIEVSIVSERLVRLHNAFESRSPATLFERR
jgi:hypothetical protein